MNWRRNWGGKQFWGTLLNLEAICVGIKMDLKEFKGIRIGFLFGDG
jgi:hypothetical protein